MLNSTDTTIRTLGVQGFGVVADDGGIITLNGKSVTTSGLAAIGLYAGIDQEGAQFLVSLSATDVIVDTSTDNAFGAYVSRDFHTGTAETQLTGGSVTTRGAGAIGLRAIGGGTLAASGTADHARREGARRRIALLRHRRSQRSAERANHGHPR